MLPEYDELKEELLIETTQNERKKPNCCRLFNSGVVCLTFLLVGISAFLTINVGKHQKCDECLTPYKQDGNFCRNGENVYKNDCTIVPPVIIYRIVLFILSVVCCFVAFLEFAKEFSLYL